MVFESHTSSGGDYHSTSSHATSYHAPTRHDDPPLSSAADHGISTSGGGGFAKLPYPIPFKTQSEHLQLLDSHSGTFTSPAASSYAAPPSGGVSHNSYSSSHDSASFSSPSSSQSHSSHSSNSIDPSVQHAADALREILNKKIPYHTSDNTQQIFQQQHTGFDNSIQQHEQHDHQQQQYSNSQGFDYNVINNNHNINNNNNEYDNNNHIREQNGQSNSNQLEYNKVQQYEIPPDPRTYVPAFRPLTGPEVLPVEVFQSHTVHTAYGLPSPQAIQFIRPSKTGRGPSSATKVGFPNYQAPPHGPGNAYLPPSSKSLHSAHPPSAHYLPPLRKYGDSSPPRMHVKRANSPNSLSNKSPMVIVREGPSLRPQSVGTADSSSVHQQQLKHLKETLGPDFEIQKSIGIELGVNNLRPPRPQISRRLTTRTYRN